MGWTERGAGLLILGTLLVGVVAFPAPARAEDAAEQPIRVQYTAPGGCPDSLSFFLHVRARTQRVRLAVPGELAALVSVAIASEGNGSVGTLEMPDPEGKPFTRRVEATSCEEVALALSLVLALAYDPDAITTFPEASPPPPPGAPVMATPSPAPAVAPPAPPAVSPFGLAFGMDALLMSGITPSLEPVFAPFVEYGTARDGGWTPRVSAALLVAPARDVTVLPSERRATLQFFGLRLLGCPASAELLPGLVLSPCLAVDGGRILGSGGGGVQQPQVQGIYWLSVAALAKIRWKIAAPLFVEVLGGGGPTIVRDGFRLLGPDELVHTEPELFGEVGLGAGMHFP